MIFMKELQKFSLRLNLLYVEDNRSVREETLKVFEPLFAHVDIAENGKEGLDKYNQFHYDIVITDINMPVMNGIEMIEYIHEVNPEQKIIAISAHDETDILLDILLKGVSSFILKPIDLDKLFKILLPVCRDADAQNVNIELFNTLQEERKKLKQTVEALTSHMHTVSIKNEQIGELYFQTKPEIKSQLLEEYFAKDEDQGYEKVVFLFDDCEEMRDLLSEIPDKLSHFTDANDLKYIDIVANDVSKIANILYRYTPFLDPLAQKLEELSRMIADDREFITIFRAKPDHILKLFDAVCIDLSLYMKRFSVESMAMKNIHHIHQPTTLSIQQIITMIHPPQDDDEGDMEFF